MGSEKISQTDMLIKIATEEGFQLEQLPEEYRQCYVSADIQPQEQGLKAVRCVDDRPVIDEEKDEALGPQIPGSSYGLVDALKILTNVSEEEAVTQIQMISEELGYAFSTHEHCGYLGLAGKTGNPLHISETLDPHQRFTRVDDLPGISLHLQGEHRHDVLALINTDPSTRFNATQAVTEGHPAFNFDYDFAQQVEQKLVQKGKTELNGQFANQVARLYLRTVKALTGTSTAYIH